jgi:hypothetical protein
LPSIAKLLPIDQKVHIKVHVLDFGPLKAQLSNSCRYFAALTTYIYNSGLAIILELLAQKQLLNSRRSDCRAFSAASSSLTF